MVSRSELYRSADGIRRELGLGHNDSTREMAIAAYLAYGTKVQELPFSTPHLCGLSHLGEPDVILLNSEKPEVSKRFALAHELIHTRLHRDKPCAFTLENPLKNRDPALEREANDGAAELLLPWREMLPLMEMYRGTLGINDYGLFYRRVCFGRQVSRSVVRIRVQELWHIMEVYRKTGSMEAAEAALDDVPTGFVYGPHFERLPRYN